MEADKDKKSEQKAEENSQPETYNQKNSKKLSGALRQNLLRRKKRQKNG